MTEVENMKQVLKMTKLGTVILDKTERSEKRSKNVSERTTKIDKLIN